MALCTSNQKDYTAKPHPLYSQDIQFDCNWEDVTRPICLDFPHEKMGFFSGALLMRRGCRPFMCEKHCSYISNFSELWKHAQLKHPHSHPSKIQPCTTTWPGNFSAALTDHRCLENYTCRSTPWSGFRWVRHRTWGCRCQRWA